jgi:hypothetical protein
VFRNGLWWYAGRIDSRTKVVLGRCWGVLDESIGMGWMGSRVVVAEAK